MQFCIAINSATSSLNEQKTLTSISTICWCWRQLAPNRHTNLCKTHFGTHQFRQRNIIGYRRNVGKAVRFFSFLRPFCNATISKSATGACTATWKFSARGGARWTTYCGANLSPAGRSSYCTHCDLRCSWGLVPVNRDRFWFILGIAVKNAWYTAPYDLPDISKWWGKPVNATAFARTTWHRVITYDNYKDVDVMLWAE